MSGSLIRPLTEGVNIQSLLALADVTADGGSLEIDYPAQLGRDALIVLSIGTVTGTNPTLDVYLEGTDDDLSGSPTWSRIKQYDGTTDLQFTQLTDADADTVVQGSIALDRTPYKHLRLYFDIGGTSTPTFPLAAVMLIGNLHESLRNEESDQLYYAAYHEQFA